MRFVQLAILLGLLAFIPHEICAQIVVEESVKTDSIDVFAGAQTSRPSMTLPVLATVVMPGLGHQMLKKEKRAIAYLSADALMIFGMIFFETNARATYANAKTFAYTYAGAQGGPGADDAYWSNVSKYMDSNGLDAAVAGYNQTQ